MNTKDLFYKLGIDAGSTTLKMMVLDSNSHIVFKSYRRHRANVAEVLREELHRIKQMFGERQVPPMQICITGSAGMGIAERAGLPFVQEVVASVELVRQQFPDIRTLIDLGGEDAKMVFFAENGRPDIRMNGNCAGGTGAFIDQMASLMHIELEALDKLAEQSTDIYPVASRCGVFAKTDIQHLISRNVPVPNLVASTLHAVALQCITTLARGCEIVAPVLCIGGPLTFISALRTMFCRILKINRSDMLLAENSEFFPAWGAALHIKPDGKSFDMESIIESLNKAVINATTPALPVLFKDESAYCEWQANRNMKKMRFRTLQKGDSADCFLGIDSGSTTTKIAVIDGEQRLVFQSYKNNDGNPLKAAADGLNEFVRRINEQGIDVRIVASAVTGYGEDLLRSAFGLDFGIVETMAHLAGARHIDAQVSFILDIGGQDMKSIFVGDGVISNVELNEACSSGCGSFLQNFANTMHLTMADFVRRACFARSPADLGSRCTVFMNSKVKQSLRENASIDDIAAGLAYSVVKNCLFKVLKINNLNMLGEHMVVQGGTFRNDAVCRALELLSGKKVASTDYPELMGAFGAALYASEMMKNRDEKNLPVHLSDYLKTVDCQRKELQCRGCTNQCTVTRLKFDNGNVCYAGNKCEKIFSSGLSARRKRGINAFERKNEIIFPQTDTRNPLKIGIPRVLNMYDTFPFWQALFTACGFEVVLSPESTVDLYRKGVGSVTSDNICFPSKLTNGHIIALCETHPGRIFYPLVPKAVKEFKEAANSYNCPIVSGYPDVIRSAIDPEGKYGIPFDTPVISFENEKTLETSCRKYLAGLGIGRETFKPAFRKALKADRESKCELTAFQKNILQKAIDAKRLIFVIAGRPYHADPLIHQRTGQILADLGADVLTDDVFRDMTAEDGYKKLNLVSQWAYPNRVVQTALQVARLPQNVQMLLLNSFGCGPDSFLMDEISAILKKNGKNLTILRIDEISSPGSVRLRLRSLVESLKMRAETNIADKADKHRISAFGEKGKHPYEPYSEIKYPATFERQDRRRTILIPWFADFISPFVPSLGKLAGYTIENLPPSNRESAEIGLKYGHNEVCYPSTLITGDIIKALQSGKYDLSNTAVAITQTGGQCRATNYIAQIKTGLLRAGFSTVPVIALAAGKPFQNEQKGFHLPVQKLFDTGVSAVLYGDALFQMYSATAVREKTQGDARALFDRYMSCGCDAVERCDSDTLLRFLKQAAERFNILPVHNRNYVKIGLIGEIFVKYNNFAQAHIGEWLRERNMEVMTPPVIDFFMQYFVNSKVNTENGGRNVSLINNAFRSVMQQYMSAKIRKFEAVMRNFRFHVPTESIYSKARYAEDILHLSNQFGEGWLLAAETAYYARCGIRKIVCIQPFGCIANHVVAKGVEKRIKKFYPEMELLYLDIDSGIAETNLQNRLHFLAVEE
ncbi:MAG: acyl-CoA dehydratase activase-related protein [Tannerella sp.]|jgi:predicted CoA-substrate-specific enzyme activase|nr:acyl-CoA dehydratase activase-related protein [Tannerella sp.]